MKKRGNYFKKLVKLYGVSRSLEEWARIKGMHPSTISKRVSRMGITLEEAIEMPLCTRFRRKKEAFTYNGKTLTLGGWSKKLNIPQSVLSQRIYTNKWSVEKAFTTPYRREE